MPLRTPAQALVPMVTAVKLPHVPFLRLPAAAIKRGAQVLLFGTRWDGRTKEGGGGDVLLASTSACSVDITTSAGLASPSCPYMQSAEWQLLLFLPL